MAVGQWQMHQLTLPHRGQAPSHIWSDVHQSAHSQAQDQTVVQLKV